MEKRCGPCPHRVYNLGEEYTSNNYTSKYLATNMISSAKEKFSALKNIQYKHLF